ncbi:MAG: tetratricopeptide repeat protein [Spirochaetales bacterium]|nr:tetratricopeptide repeat protein [Spirochaetales bacterium]
MINIDRYSYSGNYKRKRKKWKIAVFLLLFILCAAGVVFFLIPALDIPVLVSFSNVYKNMKELWNNKSYEEIISLCDEHLLKKPMDPLLLTYRGFSFFYKAKNENDEKDTLLDKTIFNLRKARLRPVTGFQGEIEYILGLTYFLKGKYYYDLSIKSMENSLASGYKGLDSYRCLGLAYGGLGETEKELDYFLEALQEEETDYSLLSVGEACMKNNQNAKAEEYLLRALNKTEDINIEQQCRFHLGEIYMANEDYLKAEQQYLRILEVNNRSANAHFYLGVIYDKLNDRIKARAQWRETLRIDPSHYQAKRHLYK